MILKKILFIIYLKICATIQSFDDNEDSYKFAIELKETFNKENAIKDDGKIEFNDNIKGDKIMDEIGLGWSLGNTFDAYSGSKQNQGIETETIWGCTKTTEDIIKGIVKKGIKTIRIPITWHNHIIDENYTIDPNWMKRIKQVVDWSISNGLYVIINTHHDNSETSNIKYGQGYYPLKQDMIESEKFLYNLFKQISLAFNNGYDHHLIFEGLCEPRLIGTEYEWTYKKGVPICEEANSVLNEYLKLIVKAIRTSGGNNRKRFIMVTPLAAFYSNVIKQDFIFPGDSKYNPNNQKLILSLHMYLPYNFAMNPDKSYINFDESNKIELYSDFNNLYEIFILKGYNVIIGEMGAINKNNTEERIKYASYYISTARKFKIPCIVFDDEIFNSTELSQFNFGLYLRGEGKWEPEALINSYVEASKTKMGNFPINEFGKNLIKFPIEFKDMKNYFEIGIGVMILYNSYCNLIIETDEPSYNPEYRMMNLFLGDWSDFINITSDELKTGNSNYEGNIYLKKGKNVIKIEFNEKNVKLIKEKGMYIIGHGFNLTRISIEGPKLISIEPNILEKTKNEEQRITLKFSEDASFLVGNIKLVNIFFNINRKIACIADKDDKKIIYCEGYFDFTGEYQIEDNKGILLSKKVINIIPKVGEQLDIINLIDEKFVFDTPIINQGLKLPSKLFKEITEKSKLVLETTDIFIEPSQRILYVLKGNSQSIIRFDSSNVSSEIMEDGAIMIPKGNNLVKICIDKFYEIFIEKGIRLIGYGFGLKTVYLE